MIEGRKYLVVLLLQTKEGLLDALFDGVDDEGEVVGREGLSGDALFEDALEVLLQLELARTFGDCNIDGFRVGVLLKFVENILLLAVGLHAAVVAEGGRVGDGLVVGGIEGLVMLGLALVLDIFFDEPGS